MKIVAGEGRKMREMFGPPTLRDTSLRGPSAGLSLRRTALTVSGCVVCCFSCSCLCSLLRLFLLPLSFCCCFCACCCFWATDRRPLSPLPPSQCWTFQNVNNIFYNQLKPNLPVSHPISKTLLLLPPLPLSPPPFGATHLLALMWSGCEKHTLAACDLPRCLYCFCYLLCCFLTFFAAA